MTTIRDITTRDLDWLLNLNNQAVPHVSGIERPDLERLLDMACYARLAVIGDERKAALIGFWPGADYASANYRWFHQRFARFLYVDRVIVADGAQGKGLGQAIYDNLERFVETRAERIALEVNKIPPNPTSMRFHRAAGYHQVGEREYEGGTKKVVMMIKELRPRPEPKD